MLVLLAVSTITTLICYFISLELEKDSKDDFLPQKTSRGLIAVSLMLFILAMMFSMATVEQKYGLLMLFIITMPLQIADFQSFTLPKFSSLNFLLFVGVANSCLARTNHYTLTLIVTVIGTMVLIFLPLGIADIYVALALSVNLFNSINCATSILLGLVISTMMFMIYRAFELKERRNKFQTIIPYVPILVNSIPIAMLIGGAKSWIIH